MDSKVNLIFFLGKCSIPLLRGNWNLIFPSFMSITAPTVRRKGRPKIIGQEGSHSDHNREINGNIIVIDSDKNIVDVPQRFLYGRINKTNTERTRIKRFQIKHIIHSFGNNGGTSSNITKRKEREV